MIKEIFGTILLKHQNYIKENIGESEVKYLEQHAMINPKKKKSINKSIDVPKLKSLNSLDNSSLNESMNSKSNRKSFLKKARTIKKK